VPSVTSAASLSARIKSQARELGFDLCGIAAADNYPELDILREWLDRGYAGDMHWMHRTAERRADVRAVVPGARSVIVTGTLYNTPSREAVSSAGAARDGALGTIARYAGGDDYHQVLERRLAALLSWMREQVEQPFDARVYVDTGPVQERVYAQYAGLGWIGKNSCLINPELGSYLFLGVIVCALPLEADTQGLEQCGACTRCLDACPTAAIVEPGMVDSTRCISYLTIETRGPIPEALRPAIGARFYGCDVCQEVCPYNQPPTHAADAVWEPREPLTQPRLIDLWRLPDDELKALVRGTAMTRAQLVGLRRNLAVAIGNSGDADAVAALAVADPDRASLDDPLVQEHVAWALARHAPAADEIDAAPPRLRRAAKLP
jgi:epoxyqueuosine reductase